MESVLGLLVRPILGVDLFPHIAPWERPILLVGGEGIPLQNDLGKKNHLYSEKEWLGNLLWANYTKDTEHKAETFVHPNLLCSMMRVHRWKGCVFSPLSAKIYGKIYKQIVIAPYNKFSKGLWIQWCRIQRRGGCVCVLLFSPITGISFKKSPETESKQRSSKYASGSITQEWGLHCIGIE